MIDLREIWGGSASLQTLAKAFSARLAATRARRRSRRSRRICIAIVGDSFVGGAGASRASRGYAHLLRTRMREVVLLPLGSGGTGFIIGCGDGRHYHGRMRQMAISEPDLVVIQATCNDLHYPDAEIAAAVTDYINIARRLPSAPRLVLLEPMFCPDAEQLSRVREVIAGVAEELDVDYIGTAGWIDAHPHLMAEDRVHPNDEGHKTIADRLMPELTDRIPARSPRISSR